jgi:hypothetical protein
MPRSRHGGRSYLGEAQASPMRNGPYRWKARHGSSFPIVSHVSAESDPRQLQSGRAHAKAWKRSPPRTGTGEATGASEVGRIGHAGKNTSRASGAPQKGECGTPKRRSRG